jgi:hypothetical protein
MLGIPDHQQGIRCKAPRSERKQRRRCLPAGSRGGGLFMKVIVPVFLNTLLPFPAPWRESRNSLKYNHSDVSHNLLLDYYFLVLYLKLQHYSWRICINKFYLRRQCKSCLRTYTIKNIKEIVIKMPMAADII